MGMLHLRTFYRILISKLGKINSLSLLLLLGFDLLALLLLLLLLLNLLLLRKSRASIFLKSEGKSSSFSSLGNTTLSRDRFITLVLVAVSTESLQLSVSQSSVLNLNSLSIIDNSAEGSLNNNNTIIRSPQLARVSFTSGSQFLLLIVLQFNSYSIKFNFIFILLLMSDGQFRSRNKYLQFLLPILFLGKHSILMFLFSFSREDMIAIIKLVLIRLLVKRFNNALFNSTSWIKTGALDG